MMSSAAMLTLACRIAHRARGDVEPNPMVGCVLERDGILLGMGHHQRFGGLHAERHALADCARRGNDPRGATAYVTLEPCCHHGKQPPCTEALIDAGIVRVVYARSDPHELSCGGAEVLCQAGIRCERCSGSLLATHLSDPFVKRVGTGLPWVIAKWAQTAKGMLTTPEGESPWITNALSLRRVHRLRARVDAIITGIGTVLADDPLLTARGVRRVRRHTLRVVLDSQGRIDPGCKLLQSASATDPVVVVQCASDGQSTCPESLADRPGIVYTTVPACDGQLDLRAVLEMLSEKYNATNVMLECGPRLLGSFFQADLVDEALVYVAAESMTMPIELAFGAHLAKLERVRAKPLAGDTELWFYRVLRGGSG